jgi:hypothetical protein
MPHCIAQSPSLIFTVFSRMWVVQEAVVAPYNECFCGEHELNFRIIMRVVVWLWYKSAFIPLALKCHQGVRNAMNLWFLEEVNNPLKYPDTNLEVLMDFTLEREATDLRDKVYGLLGVTKYSRKDKKIPDLIRPDYTKPVDRVAQDTMRFIIRENKDVAVFRNIDHGKDPGPLPEICSWCIILASRQPDTIDFLLPFYKGIIPFWNVFSEEAALACTRDPDRLHLTGIQIGLVADVSNYIEPLSDASEAFLNTTLAELVAWLSARNGQIRSNQFRRSLATTLVAGMTFKQAIATEQEIDVFEGILSCILDEYGRPSQPESAISLSVQEVVVKEYSSVVRIWSGNRKLFFTESGELGLYVSQDHP